MGASKSASFSRELNSISLIAKALGHPARIAILEHLLKVNSCICDDFTGRIPLSQPTISQHLRQLREAGLIKGTVERNTITCHIDKEGIEKLNDYLNHFSHQLSAGNEFFTSKTPFLGGLQNHPGLSA